MDTKAPNTLTINSPANDTNQSGSTLNVNWSFADNVYTYSTCSINLNNGGANDLTGIIAQNGSTGVSTNRTITGLADGVYRYNVTCIDGATNQNISNTFKVTIEGAGATLTLNPSTNTNLNLGQSKDVSCSAGTISQVTSMTLETVGEKTICSNQNTASCSGTYVAGASGDKTLKCTATTSAGVTVTKSIVLSVLTDSGTPTVTSSGGGGGGASTVQFDIDFTKVSEDRIVEGEGSIVSFTLDGSTQHKITFTNVEATGVKLTIASTPKIIDLKIGEQVNVDSDDNGIYDLAVTLNGISTSGFADVIVKKISMMVPTTVTSGVSEPKEVPIVSAEQAPPSKEVTPPVTQAAKPKVSLLMLLGLIVIIFIVGVVFYFTQRGKVGRNKKYRP